MLVHRDNLAEQSPERHSPQHGHPVMPEPST
jgi:hypothetical protein